MNKNPYLHYDKDKNNLIKLYFIALIPLLLFGFYKNGILLYQNGLISFADMFIPLYFYIISVIISFLVAWIIKAEKQEYMLYGLILACTISINTNMLIYPIVLFVSLFIATFLKKKKEFNILAFTRILLILALLLNSYSYMNVAEKINAFNYNYFDIFLGYGVGGLASNSLFFALLTFLILSFSKFYKRIIPTIASISFLIVLVVLFLITKNDIFLENLLNGSAYFAFIFVGADLYISPCTKKGKIIYGFVIGLFSAILSLFIPIYEAPYIAILFFSFLFLVFDKIIYKKCLQASNFML